MRITPLDIRKQEFRRTMRGLDADEVYAFLGTVSEEYEAVLSDNKRLREHIVQLEERLKEFKTMETNLRNTLLTAERITAEAKENARREAELIVRGAEVEASKATETIRAHTQQLRREILELKKHKDNYATRLRALLESHMRVVEGFTEDFAEVDSEIEAIGRQVEQDTKTSAPAPRMSRERITEDIAAREVHQSREAADKVTWGDERQSEEIERPVVPGPGRRQQSAPGRSESATDPEQAQRRDRERHSPEPEIDFGADDTAAGAPAGAEAERASLDRDSKVPGGEELNRVAQDPTAGHGPAAGPDRAAAHDPAAGSDRAAAHDPAPVQGPAPGSDEWRSYEVKAERQDWSSYEVPRTAAPQPQPSWPGGRQVSGQTATENAPQAQRQPETGSPPRPQRTGSRFAAPLQGPPPASATPRVHAERPNENEVEQALSGLTEISGSAAQTQQTQVPKTQQPQQPPPRQTEQPSMQQQPQQPQMQQPQQQPPQPDHSAPAAQRQQPAPDTGPAAETGSNEQELPEDEGALWTMEQLRRNLTNIDRDK